MLHNPNQSKNRHIYKDTWDVTSPPFGFHFSLYKCLCKAMHLASNSFCSSVQKMKNHWGWSQSKSDVGISIQHACLFIVRFVWLVLVVVCWSCCVMGGKHTYSSQHCQSNIFARVCDLPFDWNSRCPMRISAQKIAIIASFWCDLFSLSTASNEQFWGWSKMTRNSRVDSAATMATKISFQHGPALL